MQLLQHTTCLHDVLVVLQTLSCFAEQGLQLQVLLEIQIAQLDIDLHQVIELLLVLLIGFTNLLRLLRSYGTDRLPLGLQLTHLLQVSHHAVGIAVLYHRLHLLEDSLLATQVLRLLFGLRLRYLCTLRFILRQELLELLFQLLRLLGIESCLQMIYLVLDCHNVFRLQQLLEFGNNLFSCHIYNR